MLENRILQSILQDCLVFLHTILCFELFIFWSVSQLYTHCFLSIIKKHLIFGEKWDIIVGAKCLMNIIV